MNYPPMPCHSSAKNKTREATVGKTTVLRASLELAAGRKGHGAEGQKFTPIVLPASTLSIVGGQFRTRRPQSTFDCQH